MRHPLTSFFFAALAIFISTDSYAMKWQGLRQSDNVIDIRRETKLVNSQADLEIGRRALVAMIMMAEKDHGEHPECVTLGQEIEKLKTVRSELEGMGLEPVRRLSCTDPSGSAPSRVNLCAQLLAKKASDAPDSPSAPTQKEPDLKEFESELADSYGPPVAQVGRLQAALQSSNEALAKESLECRASLQLIQKKSGDIVAAFANLQRLLQEYIR